MLLFILNVVKERPQIESTEAFTMKAQGWKQEKLIQFNRNQESLSFRNIVSRDFILAKMSGNLKKKGTFWWQEVFCVLSNIGLVIMKNSTDKFIQLYPFLDFEIFEDKNELMFTLKTINKKSDLILQVYSIDDFNLWINALKDFRIQIDKKIK